MRSRLPISPGTAVFLLAMLVALSACAPPVGADPAVPPTAYAGLRWRPLGPFRAGWATSVAGVPGDPRLYYFGSAGGGVWRTRDAGRTWEPLMQHERSASVGALAIAPSDPRVIYVGTGQEGSRYDILPGDGVYRSGDGGETWTNIGLPDSRHIGAILVDPRDPDRVLVAAIGRAFAPSPERGVYQTTDGGRHWTPVLQAGDSTGAVDLAWDPADPRVVYAALWQRRMHPWLDYFQPQAGPGSGIWRSDDGGRRWARLGEGLPHAPMGRIGLAVARGSAGRIVYATIEVPRPAGAAPGTPSESGLYRSDDRGAHWEHVNQDGSLGSSYFGRLTVEPKDPNTIYVMGQSIRCSRDGGRHFEVVRGSPGGDDYHHLWINPDDPQARIAGSDQGAAVSVNGGATWSSWYNQPTGQFYHLAADDRFPYHVYSGQQDNGTVEIASRGAYGVIEERDWHPVGGDERDDMVPVPDDPATVIGSGLGGTVSRFDDVTRQSANVSPWPIGSYGANPTTVRYRYGWLTPLEISPIAPHAIYLGAQVLFRSLDRGNHWTVVSPDLSGRRDGAGPCTNPDPAAARACGFGVISAIAPSPIAKDLLWVGTDDGLVHVTADGGRTWRDVTPPALPAWGRVSAISPSALDRAVAYVAVDLHRSDRHAPLLFATRDGGRTWRTIVAGLPGDEFTSVVRADPVRAGLLFAGTDRAVYVSFDDGAAWQSLALDLPTTWMRDLLVHQGDLIVATQGRGIWVLDDIAPLRELAAGAARQTVHLFTPARAVRLRASENHDTPWPPETPLGENPPTGAVLDYWLDRPATGAVTLTISDRTGAVVRRFASTDPPESLGANRYFESAWVGVSNALATEAGMHRFVWDLREPTPRALDYRYSIAAVRTHGTPVRPAGAFVLPAGYTVALTANGATVTRPLTVALDPRVRISDQDLRAQHDLTRSAIAAMERGVGTLRETERVKAARGTRVSSALADSLARLTGDDDASLRTATRRVSGLIDNLQSADAAPTQGVRTALDDYTRRIDALIARWRRVQAMLGETASP